VVEPVTTCATASVVEPVATTCAVPKPARIAHMFSKTAPIVLFWMRGAVFVTRAPVVEPVSTFLTVPVVEPIAMTCATVPVVEPAETPCGVENSTDRTRVLENSTDRAVLDARCCFRFTSAIGRACRDAISTSSITE